MSIKIQNRLQAPVAMVPLYSLYLQYDKDQGNKLAQNIFSQLAQDKNCQCKICQFRRHQKLERMMNDRENPDIQQMDQSNEQEKEIDSQISQNNEKHSSEPDDELFESYGEPEFQFLEKVNQSPDFLALLRAPNNNRTIQKRSENEGQPLKPLAKTTLILNSHEEEEEKIINSLIFDDSTQGKRKSANRKIKIDQAFKPFLRGLRRCLHSLHKETTQMLNQKTHYHWGDQKIFSEAKSFLEQRLFRGTEEDFSDKDVWKMVAMLYPTKATILSSKKGRENQPSCLPLYQALGEHDIKIFRDIFQNNNSTQINKFFNDSFIRKLWPILREHMKFEHCFKNCQPNENILSSYAEIKRILGNFGILVPLWWEETFNSEAKMNK